MQKRIAGRRRDIVGGFGRKLNRPNPIERPLDWNVESQSGESTYSPGPTPTVAATVKIEPSAGGMKTTIDATSAEGKPTQTESVARFDGKDYPVKGAQAPNTTNALKRIDDRTFEVMGKIDGKPALTTRDAVAADGKTMTATQTGTNAQGQSVKNVIVLNKQ